MLPSRGMGAIRSSKMPGRKVIKRKDDPDKVLLFKEGGDVEGKFKPVESDFNVKVMGGGSADKYGKGLGGRISATKKLAKDLELEGYLEGFAAKPKGGSSMAELTGGGVKLTKRFAKGGESRVNESGNYTKPGLRKSIFERIKAVVKGVLRVSGAPARHK
jgi:hypothetical protein